jgi:hypothetical protein
MSTLARRIPKVSAPLLWAFLSTSSAAFSTLIYLLFAHGQPWGPEFIQLYAVIGLFSGWSNALIYYLAPHYLFLQGRAAALVTYLLGIVITLTLDTLIFSANIQIEELIFTAGVLIPILYANAFGLEFSEGNYPWPYKRVVVFNLLLALGAMAAVFAEDTRHQLFLNTGLVGVLSLLFWLSDRWNRVANHKTSVLSVQAWLNPAVPVLERSVWDQWTLSRFGTLELSFWVYLLGRGIGFIGNLTYSFLMGRATAMHERYQWNSFKPILFAGILLVPLSVLVPFLSWTPILFGQIFSLTLSALLTLWFRQPNSTFYLGLIVVWLGDFALRAAAFHFSDDMKSYLAALFLFTTVELALLGFFLWRRIKLSRERTSTRLPLGDSPNIR